MRVCPRRVSRPGPAGRVAGAAFALAVLVAACGDSNDARRPSDVVAQVSEKIATVVVVRWTTSVPTTGYVEFGPTSALGARTPVESIPALEHTATVVGLTADKLHYYRAVSAEGGAAVAASGVDSIRTGGLPTDLPDLTQTGSGYDGFVVVPILGGITAVTIINSKGEIVWYRTEDRALQFYRARLSVDGKSVLYNAAQISGDPTPDSEIVRVSLDGSQAIGIPVPYLAHDFVEHPDGTLAALTFEDRDLAGTRVRGNKLVEIATDGTLTTVWTSWNCFDPATVTGDDPPQGWTFANALDYDPAEDVYYVGMRNFSSIAKVNRAGACEWVLGQFGSTLTFAAGTARFLHQHQFDVHGNRIVVMDNDGAPGDESRVVEYEIDVAAKTATQVWSYIPMPTIYTFVLGEPIRLADGGTFVNWSAAGQMERLDAGGMPVWKLNTPAGLIFGFQTIAATPYGGSP
jgi:arylsulfotransferase ASST